MFLLHQPGEVIGYHFPFIKTLPSLIFPLENQRVSSMIEFSLLETIYCLYCPSERFVRIPGNLHKLLVPGKNRNHEEEESIWIYIRQ